jgi:translocation and assembly module TamA
LHLRFWWASAALAAVAVFPASIPPLAAQDASVQVEVEGIDGELEANVRAMLEIARAADEGAPLSSARVRQLHDGSEDDIRLALQPFGFYEPVVRSSLRRSEDAWIARYVVEPGAPTIVRSASVELSGDGADSPAFRREAAEFPLQPGDTLRHAPYETAKIALLAIAADSGYLDADFDTTLILVDREADTAGILIRFDTGPRYHFGPVTFEQSILDPEFLRTRIPFERGDLFRQDRLLELHGNLAEDPYFVSVSVMPRPDLAVGLEVPIEVELEPQRPQSYEVGAGYGTDTGPRARAAARFRRLNRRGHNAEVEVTGSLLEQSVSTRYTIPAVLHPTGALTFLAGYAALNPEEVNSRTALVGARLTRRRFGWNESFSLTYQRAGFEIGADTAVSSLLTAGTAYDRTWAESQVYPMRGLRTRLEVTGAHSALLSDATFVRAVAGVKAIRGLGPRLRGIVRGDIGRLFTDDFSELPPAIRFFAGGDQSVRGYRYQALGPRDELGNSTGGRLLLAGSIEADYRVLDRWAVAVFTDAGNALDSFSLDLQYAVGAGVRWLSPVGLVRLDGAFAIERPEAVSGGDFRLHVMIGPDL